eukprot:Gb_33108 [translate_table: standard]
MPASIRRSSCMERWRDIFFRYPLQLYLLTFGSVLEIAAGGVILAMRYATPGNKSQGWMLASGIVLVTIPVAVWIVLIIKGIPIPIPDLVTRLLGVAEPYLERRIGIDCQSLSNVGGAMGIYATSKFMTWHIFTSTLLQTADTVVFFALTELGRELLQSRELQ